MDISRVASAYRQRADRSEAHRLERFEMLRGRAQRMGTALREAFGPKVSVYLFGSLLDADTFHGASDIDLAVEGLDAREYWDAWSIVESLAEDATMDFLRVETASVALRRVIRQDGEVLG